MMEAMTPAHRQPMNRGSSIEIRIEAMVTEVQGAGPVEFWSPGKVSDEVRGMILEARQTVARGVNAALVVLYWNIGQRIRRDILREKRADYGERIFHSLSGKLTAEFGRGFTKTNLFNMVRFAEVFPDSR